MGSSKKSWMKKLTQRKKSSKKNTTASVEKTNKWTFWKHLKIWLHSNKIISSKYGSGNWGLSKEERAAVCIQTAFRRYLARKVHRALKGLTGLQQALIAEGDKKLTPANLRCIQAFVRLQAQTLANRGIKEKEDINVFQASTEQTTESSADWCNALGSVEEIQAKLNQKHEAAIKRERAIVYAFANKWRANSKIKLEDLFDHDLDNSAWAWMWLDRWISNEEDVIIKPKKSKGEESKTHVAKVEIKKKVILKRWPSGKGKRKSTSKVKDSEKPVSRRQSSKIKDHEKPSSEVSSQNSEKSRDRVQSKKQSEAPEVSSQNSEKSRDKVSSKKQSEAPEVSSQNSEKSRDKVSSKKQSATQTVTSKRNERPSSTSSTRLSTKIKDDDKPTSEKQVSPKAKLQSPKSKYQEKPSSEKQVSPKATLQSPKSKNHEKPSSERQASPKGNLQQSSDKSPSKKQSPKSKPASKKQLPELSSQNGDKQLSKEQLHNGSIQNGHKSLVKENVSDLKKPKALNKTENEAQAA